MGLFSNQFSNVVEWEEFREDMIFWKWTNREIKKGSRLILRPGQDATFLYNGRMEGHFTDDGDYDIESQIIPFLSTLKGFKFGFNSGMRAEVLFVNTKEFTEKWGTKNAINIPHPNLPGGVPVRAFGTFNCKVYDHVTLIDKIAGIKQQFYMEDVRTRVSAILDQLLMKWIMKEGKDFFNLQANSYDIAKGIQTDLDMEIMKLGITITGLNIISFNYPEEVQKMINKVASQGMVGNMGHYQQVSMVDAMASGKNNGANVATDMASMQMGMMMANQMVQNMNQNQSSSSSNTVNSSAKSNFCPNCGTKTGDGNFCSNCGQKLI